MLKRIFANVINDLNLFWSNFQNPDNLDYLVQQIIVSLILIFLVTMVALLLIKYFGKLNQRIIAKYLSTAKQATLFILWQKIIKALIAFLAVLIIFNIVGINTTSLLATAGISTLIIGFGAQSLIKDLINGIFIIFENQYVVGEYIRVGNLEGEVIELGLRLTKIRAYNGELHFIPNSMMNGVINTSREPMRALIDIHLPYDIDIEAALNLLNGLIVPIEKELADVLRTPIEFLGITASQFSTFIVTYRTFTEPEKQWAVERYIMTKAMKTLAKSNLLNLPNRFTGHLPSLNDTKVER